MKRTQQPTDGAGEAPGARDAAGAEVYRMAHIARPAPDPMPLYRTVPTEAPFPLDALPGAIRDGVIGAHAATESPVALCVNSALACASLMVAKIANVELYFGGHAPTSLNLITVADSGDRKSTTDELLIKPIREYEEELNHLHAQKLAEHGLDVEAYETAKSSLKKRFAKDRAKLADELKALKAPKQLTCPDILVEAGATESALYNQLRDGLGFAGIFTDEGGTFLASHAMRAETKASFIGRLNNVWDGAPLKRSRVEAGTKTLFHRRAVTHIMIQPGIAETLLRDAMMNQQGFLARFFIAWPESRMGRRTGRPPAPHEVAALERFRQRVRVMLDHPVRYGRSRDGEEMLGQLDLELIALSKGARAYLRDFDLLYVEPTLGRDGALRPHSGFGAKLTQHVTRLAAVFTCFGDPDARTVQIDAAESAAKVGQWYATEYLRAMNQGSISASLLNAERLLVWLRAWPSERVWLADVYQRGPQPFRTASKARAGMLELERHGLVRKVDGGCMLDGVRRKDVWELVREAPLREAA